MLTQKINAVDRDIYGRYLYRHNKVYSMNAGLIHEDNIEIFLISRDERTKETGVQLFWNNTAENVDHFPNAILFDGYWLIPDEAVEFLAKYDYPLNYMHEIKEC